MSLSLFNLKQRSLKPELMDRPEMDWDEHREALKGLERINSFSLASGPIWQAIVEQVGRNQKLKILDLATGAGDLPMMLAGKAEQLGFNFEIDGCDKSAQAVRYAREKAESLGVKVRFFELDIKQEKIPNGYDLLTNALFLHHLTYDETVTFIQNMKRANPKMIVLNDLIRSRLGLFFAYMGTRLLSRSKVVHYDGPQSVRAAYTIPEISALARHSGLNQAHIKGLLPARFLLTWKN